ncbi:hypothetical protein [Tenuibacillus multivorans]|uniref:Uncharacterized protein n=1 Tax=Tenuibacillus multivorans TaxID=237069 RepID=A0A1G9ZV79_9BACI|nr:hypothetical protein [Tenuibacillus multivorans]GEL76861.1 hypothetical protein TMU01_10960 [Tenuibacillus multivorans]SDN25044.1 hypothetical protein SAMN05216498_1854 [Tenuibacillus multivorans]
MFVFNKREVADEKLNHLLEGYSVYAETEELIRLMNRRIQSQELDIIIDDTDQGCWFIPNY